MNDQEKQIKGYFDKTFGKIRRTISKVETKLKAKKKLLNRLRTVDKPEKRTTIQDCKVEIFSLGKLGEAHRLYNWDDELVNSDQTENFYRDLATDIETISHLKVDTQRRIPVLSSQGYESIALSLQKRLKKLPEIDFPKVPLTFFFSLSDVEHEINSYLNSPQMLRYYSKTDYLASKELWLRQKEKDEADAEEELTQNKRLAQHYLERKNHSNNKPVLSTISDLINLDPVQFEIWVKKYIFEPDGWQVTETKITHDGGIDLVLLSSDNRLKGIAQCKRYLNSVGEPVLRDFYGTMVHSNADIGYFITTGVFTLAALEFTREKPIKLIDKIKLIHYYL